MKKETLLVTGGAGFIGSHLIERLIKEGYFILCLDNFNDYYNPKIKEKNISHLIEKPNFRLIRGDILDVDLLHKIFSGKLSNGESENKTRNSKPNKVIHLAAMAGVRSSIINPAVYIDVDIKGTVNLLEMARDYNIKHFVFASSSSVYGINEKTPFSEDDPVNRQISPYATAKRAAELYCKTYHNLYGTPVTVLRFFTVYGERQRPDMAIRKFAKLIMEGNPIPMFGDGSSIRDYTYIDDCIECLYTVVEKPMDFEIINVGSGKTITLKQLIKVLEEISGRKIELTKLEEQTGDVPVTYADISKAKRLLDYKPRVNIEEGIRRFFEWYEKEIS